MPSDNKNILLSSFFQAGIAVFDVMFRIFGSVFFIRVATFVAKHLSYRHQRLSQFISSAIAASGTDTAAPIIVMPGVALDQFFIAGRQQPFPEFAAAEFHHQQLPHDFVFHVFPIRAELYTPPQQKISIEQE